MKRIYICLLIFVLSSLAASAQTVSESTARSRANAFFAQQTPSASGPRRATSKQEPLTLAYTSQGNGNTRFYVYNRGENDGYVIMGGDEQAKEILAYVPQGHFVYDSLPDNMKWWLGQYENEIDTAIIVASHAPQRTIQKAPIRSSVANTYQDIPDLITTKWNQDYPYNCAIPSVVDGNNTYQCYTGCVPTALAQIMKYWGYPLHGNGSKSYSITYSGEVNQTVVYSADLENTTYDWNNMRDTYVAGQYTQQEALAVGTLMYHIGVALGVDYSWFSTGYSPVYDDNMGISRFVQSLRQYFSFDKQMEQIFREDYTLEQWETTIYEELNAGRPVYCSSRNNQGIWGVGHAFICHGYSSDLQMFSFNWGWGGEQDGYFSFSGTNALNGYGYDVSVLIGLMPQRANQDPTNVCFGDRFKYNGIWYKVYDARHRQVEVTHPDWDEAPDHSYCYGEVTIPDRVPYNGAQYTVSRIGSYAFNVDTIGNSWPTNVNLPNSIKSLGRGVFHYCYYVDSITLPDSIQIIPSYCFYNSKISKINLPNQLKVIDPQSFWGCSRLTEIEIPEGTLEIENFAFFDCGRLSVIHLPSTLQYLGTSCFWQTNLMLMVNASEYLARPLVWDVSFPNSVKDGILYVPSSKINEYKTADQWKYWGTILPIENYTPSELGHFIEVDGIEYQVVKNDEVTLIKLVNPDTIEELTLPSNIIYQGTTYHVTAIGSRAFADNSVLKKCVVSEGIKRICTYTFSNSLIREIQLPQSLEIIENHAFSSCMELRSLDIPGNVFIVAGISYCPNLKQVILREGIQGCAPDCLTGCPNLKSLVLPSSMWYYGDGNFAKCYSLNTLVALCDSSTIPNLAELLLGIENPRLTRERIGDWAGMVGLDGFGTNFDTLYTTVECASDMSSVYHTDKHWTKWENLVPVVRQDSFVVDSVISIMVNEQKQIPYTVFPSNATIKELKWVSSDDNIVSVNSDGILMPHAVGQATITASSYFGNEMVRICNVSVTEAEEPQYTGDYLLYLPNYSHSFQTSTTEVIAESISFEGGDLMLSLDVNWPYRQGAIITVQLGDQKQQIDYVGENRHLILSFKDVQRNPSLSISVLKATEMGIFEHDFMPWAVREILNIRVWSPSIISYPIRFINYDGTVLSTDYVRRGVTPTYTVATPTKPATAQYTYTFKGWDKAIVSVVGAETYTAQFDSVVNKYAISFINEDSILLQTSEFDYGATPVYTGVTPTKPATAQYTYTFIGWDKEVVSVVGAETYTAQFDSVVNQYTITFLDENGTILQTSEVEYGQVPAYNGATPTKPATAEHTFSFSGWSPNVVAVTAAATYTATYSSTINSYLITFVNYDGSTLQSGNVNYGITPSYICATPTKPATAQYTYTFKGWDKAIVSVVGAETYTAQFDSVVNKYAISFINEDSILLQTSEFDYGATPVYTGVTPTKPATAQYTYTFIGWDKDIVSVVGAETYTAQFDSIVNQYTITFLDENGTTLQTSEVEYGQVPAYNGATPSKPSTGEFTYTFAGWSPEVVSVTGNATYTATYSSVVNQYTITVSGENCTITGAGTYDYGTEITLTVTSDDGYQFVAWSDGNTDSSRQITVTEDVIYTAILEKIETGWEENVLKEKGRVIFDGHHFYILRDGQLYDAAGRKQD